MVDEGGGRLVQDFCASPAQGKAQVGVCVIGRAVAGVKASQRHEILAADGQAGAGHVVGLADKVVLRQVGALASAIVPARCIVENDAAGFLDRKSTRLNSSHVAISYAVFCLK